MIYKVYIPKQGNDGKPFAFEPIVKEMSQVVAGFTVYDGQGYWEGIFEPVWIFEIVTDALQDFNEPIEETLQEALKYLKVSLNQQAMFYTKTETGTGVLI